MSESATGAGDPEFTPLRVGRVVPETHDTISLVLDIPAAQRDRFRYRAGQYLTVRVRVAGREHQRCYSMSSSPVLHEGLRITVKRERDGLVSNWLHDTVAVGDAVEAAAPRGRFVLAESDRPLVAFAGGSGITPVFSLLRTALARTERPVRLFYANRDSRSVIFAEPLDRLAQRHGDRLLLHHHLDADAGLVAPSQLAAFTVGADDADYYVCGPAPFMDAVENTLIALGTAPERIRLERFRTELPGDPGPTGDPVTEQVVVQVGRRRATVGYRSGSTLLQVARAAGLRPPSSCETGSCGTCIARVTEGRVRLLNNDVLTDEELAEGLTLTCQSLPIGPTVRVIWE
ncbi:ferredoxin--NADP reductase [Nocardia sp. alder85J]|uniref:ferredoxin--NADP reductase n=1 Tax=Nocardia sp. alder85J TaxID=2862949 RepID=UPI001CD20119|nr:ferredoxin--NADP reductase [Nocardia sp. alder85J]MCX4091347.1 ferredoxin--NADP reductase [Nocardia sp. alder85J]